MNIRYCIYGSCYSPWRSLQTTASWFEAWHSYANRNVVTSDQLSRKQGDGWDYWGDGKRWNFSCIRVSSYGRPQLYANGRVLSCQASGAPLKVTFAALSFLTLHFLRFRSKPRSSICCVQPWKPEQHPLFPILRKELPVFRRKMIV